MTDYDDLKTQIFEKQQPDVQETGKKAVLMQLFGEKLGEPPTVKGMSGFVMPNMRGLAKTVILACVGTAVLWLYQHPLVKKHMNLHPNKLINSGIIYGIFFVIQFTLLCIK
jgi:hypothetical protein